jgi:hypothetical protein
LTMLGAKLSQSFSPARGIRPVASAALLLPRASA